MNFREELESVLRQDSRFISSEGLLLKPRIRDAAAELDTQLIRSLRASKTLAEHFFVETDGIVVFEREKFMWVVNSKEFLPDSYTKYRNKIGLSTDDERLLTASSEVALIWPYKDCVLAGGQSGEDENRVEIFYNEILAPDEVGRLLAPKAFKSATRYSVAGSEPVTAFSDTDNLIIKGNNLLALGSLLDRYEGQVKCIYIDPPYNTQSDSFLYNDRFNHSTWLTFMQNRLELAKRLLRPDGFIFVQCDDNEQAYLKVLMDSIFRRENFINLISVKTKIGGVSGSSEGKSLKDELEYINLYAKDREREDTKLNHTYVSTDLSQYIQSYKDSGKSWKYTSVLTELSGKVLLEEDEKLGEKLYGYEHVKSMSVSAFAKSKGISEDEVYAGYADKIFRTTNAQSSVRARVVKNSAPYEHEVVSLEYTPQKGKNAGLLTEILYKGTSRSMVMFLSDVVAEMDGRYVYRERVGTLWSDIQYNNLVREGEVSFSNGKKPEALVQRVLEMSTEPDDIVLDFHLGSGTTAAVAHKMGRRYIGVEQMEYIDSIAVDRLHKVVRGEQNGISEQVGWAGGGSFIFAEMADKAEQMIDRVQEAKDAAELYVVLEDVIQQGLLKPSILPEDVLANKPEFEKLTLEEQKDILAELVDKNRLYLNASDLDDKQSGLNNGDKAFTRSFYSIGGSINA